MTDRYRYPPQGRFNPARVSLAGNLANYGSVYAAGTDADFVSSPTRYTTAVPRAYPPPVTPSSTAAAAPSRSYTLSQEPRPSSRLNNREPSRSRRSTLDVTTSRPPIIVTSAMQDHHPHNAASHSSAASHSANPSTHNASPVREPYRASDGKLYTQPASSIRSRSTNRPYHASSSSDDYPHPHDHGELVLASRDADNYRNSRPSVLYPSDPRHSNAAIDYGDDGYQYTNAGELVKYDLDHATTPAPPPSRSRRHERHESFDRGYHRPNINYNADQRSFNVNTSHDLNRHYNTSSSSRAYDTRGGPPPSTRGFDKIKRVYENVPPAAPVPPSPAAATAGPSDSSAGALVRRDGRRPPRPVSLNHDFGSRASQSEDYYRGHVPDDNSYDRPRFFDDSVTARGFGIRVNPSSIDHDDRQGRYRDPKRDEGRDDLTREDVQRREKPRMDGSKGSDDDASRGSDPEREEWHRAYKEGSRDRLEARRPSDGEHEIRPSASFRDKLTAGLGIAASAVGLGLSTKKDERKSVAGDSKGATMRRASPDDTREEPRDRVEREQERNGEMGRKSEADLRERHRGEAEARLNGEQAVVSGSDSEEVKRPPSIRRRASSVSSQREPMVAASHKADEREREEVTSQPLARARSASPAKAKDEKKEIDEEEEVEDKEKEDGDEKEGEEEEEEVEVVVVVKSKDKEEDDEEEAADEENRGRDLVVHSEAKQVRVVSPPPREKKEGKPLKGILKQPSAKFPEDRNPIREGVAPHKDDKKLKEVPPGAKWTKINRKVVNPEALEKGKERFEVRDDFVIVLRVLSKEEIQMYATATQVLRERRRNKELGDRERDYEGKFEDHDAPPYEEDRGRRSNSHHQRRHRGEEKANGAEEWNDEWDRDRDRDRDRERRRRSRREDDEYTSRTREADHGHRRWHRERT